MPPTNAPIDEAPATGSPRPGPRAWVFSIQRSRGGVPKLPIREALVTAAGLDGDGQVQLKYHGGPDRALCLYSLERILTLQQEGHHIYPGALGENLTLAGLDWTLVVPGVTLQIGPVLAQITDYAVPCNTIGHTFSNGRYGRISQKTHPGFSRAYARVLEAGLIRVADEVALIAPGPAEPQARGDVA